MKIGNAVVAVAVFLSVLFGCTKADEKKSPDAPHAREGSAKSGEFQAPYYYGLIEEYKMLIAEDPDNLAGIIALGNAYYDSGQWKEAITVYTRALRIDPRNADVRTDRGTSYRNIGMPDRALAEYRTALEYEPGHQNARYNMGIIYAYDKKDYTAAIRVWEDLLRLSPNHPQSNQMRTCIVTFKKMLKKKDVK